MEAFSFIVLILLSLVAYSAGAAAKAGQSVDLKPKIVDLILVAIIWAGAIYSRVTMDLNRWLLILICIILSFTIGMLATMPRKLHGNKRMSREKSIMTSKNLVMNLWQSWKDFSKRMGSFQSRIILSMFFFLLVSPFALAVKIFSDPLRIKSQREDSHWLHKKEIKSDLGQFRRQF